MNFEEKDGVYLAKLRCGDVVRFESEEEALAAQAMYEDVQELLGKMRNSECGIRNSERGTPKKKKVRINIDPDVEFVGTPSTTSQAKRSPSLGDGGMKKALA